MYIYIYFFIKKNYIYLYKRHVNNFYSRYLTDVYDSSYNSSRTAFYQNNSCLYCLKQNRIRFEMIDFLLRLCTPVKRNGEKNIEEEIERIFEIHSLRFTRYGIKLAQLQLLWQQFKTFSKYFRCTNSFWLVYPDALRSLVVYVAAKISIDFRNNSVCVWNTVRIIYCLFSTSSVLSFFFH